MDVEQEPSQLLYNATLSLYRLSPLHLPKTVKLSHTRTLAAHARRLSDALKGDVLRGLRVALDDKDQGLVKSGPLKQCRWTWIDESPGTDSEIRGADGFGVTEGICVEIEYERTSYIAWLLGSRNSDGREKAGELHLPLLALRMPNALRELFLNYLGSTFDTRVDMLHVPSSDIGKALEGYLEACMKYSDQVLLRLLKDIQLSFHFKNPVAPSLRSLDMTFKREDLTKLMKEGERIRGQQQKPLRGPFLSAVCKYLNAQLALDVEHKDILLGRVACGAFALGKEGKLKIFSPYFDDDDEHLLAASKEATIRLLQQLLAMAAQQTNKVPPS